MQVSSQLQAPAILAKGKVSQLPTESEAPWAPEPVWQSGDKKIPCICWKSNHDSSGVQPVVYYQYANYTSLNNGMKMEVRKY